MNITALIFEQISGFNRKSTTRAATRDAERGEKERKRDGEFSFRSTIFSFTLARKKKEERRKVKGEKNAP